MGDGSKCSSSFDLESIGAFGVPRIRGSQKLRGARVSSYKALRLRLRLRLVVISYWQKVTPPRTDYVQRLARNGRKSCAEKRLKNASEDSRERGLQSCAMVGDCYMNPSIDQSRSC